MADASRPTDVSSLPQQHGPRPGALSLLTPAQRGLTLAIIQADRSGRGGNDLEVLSGHFHSDSDAKAQLITRVDMLSSWGLPKHER